MSTTRNRKSAGSLLTPERGEAQMLWDNEKDADWTQRWKNGVFLKWWVKNETRDKVLPWVVLVALILLALMGLARLFAMQLGL